MACDAASRKRPREECKQDEFTPLIQGPGVPILKVNPVKAKLKRGDIVLAGTVLSTSLDSAVTMASNFDLLWIEGEHSHITLETTRNIILATRGMRAMPFVRVPWQEMWMAKRVMDIGAMGVIFPFSSTPERAQQCVRACRYPPKGNRGCGPTLSQLSWGLDESTYYDWANDNIMCVIIIEEAHAVENVDQIAATPGIDLLFIGTSDLSFSITGDKRAVGTQPVKAAMEKVVEAGRKCGIPIGCPAGSAEQMQVFKDMGLSFFQAPPDLNFLQQGIQQFTGSLAAAGLCGAAGDAKANGSFKEDKPAQVC
jgi:2-keto-3-deoxy-L-rhamnonate aldolase RhmA